MSFFSKKSYFHDSVPLTAIPGGSEAEVFTSCMLFLTVPVAQPTAAKH